MGSPERDSWLKQASVASESVKASLSEEREIVYSNVMKCHTDLTLDKWIRLIK
jgi:hypothetical protein